MSHRIYIPVAQFHRGNTATYVERALRQLGCETRIVGSPEFYQLLATDKDAFFLCVDSGEPIDLESSEIRGLSLERVGYWLIDFRHHKDGPRKPTDVELCQSLAARRGWIFQSQFEDFEFSLAKGWGKSIYLPLAADPEIWSDLPAEPKNFDLAFAGNVWDLGRATVLESVLRMFGVRFGFQGHGSLWMEDAAKLLRSAKVGFNVNSWFGTDHAFDVNMRFFETLSCGLPLITNWVPCLEKIFPNGAPFLATYRTVEEVRPLIKQKLADRGFLESGPLARKWVLENATYAHRMRDVIAKFTEGS